MWECKKCSKPVYFAERKQSLGFDWHPNCLRCEECGKRLNPGQHAEHKGVPFCHHPCYGALFGPQLFGHGTRNECHTSFGKVSNRDGHIKRSHLETQLKIYNNFYESKHGELKSREVNGRLVLEGALRVYWGVKNPIHLKEEDDSRMIAVRRRSCSGRENYQAYTCHSDSEDNDPLWRDDDQSFNKRISAPENLTISLDNTSEIADSTLNESEVQTEQNSSQLENESTNFEMNHSSESMSNLVNGHGNHNPTDLNGGSGEGTPKDVDLVVDRNGNRSRSTAIRRRPGRRMVKTKLKRRCSINGHFYLRETSSFIPPFGSSCSIWISSKTSPEEVLNRLLEKYKVEMSVSNFALFVVKDNGELRRIKAEESPLVTRVMLGPCEDVAKVFIMDVQTTREVSHEAAQFLNLSLAECRSILVRYEEEELKNIEAIKNKYKLLRALIEKRIREDRIKNNVS